MKKSFLLLPVFIVLIVMSGCKKEQHYTSGNDATFNVINGIINNTALIKMNGSINSSGINSSGGNQSQISFGLNLFFFTEAKNTDVGVLNRTDSSILASKNIDFKNGGIYTMLLAGIAPNAEMVVVDDTDIPEVDLSEIPADADSIVYVRFINLAPDVPGIDVRIQGATTYELTGLPYKTASAWKAYPAKVANGFFTRFEFVENGTLRSFGNVRFPTTTFKNVSLVLTGMKNPVSGQPGLSVKTVNYFQ